MKGLFWFLTLGFALTAEPVFAERRYTVGGAIDAVGAMDSNPLLNTLDSGSRSQTLTRSYGLYPSLDFSSTGRHSTLEMRYTFALNRADTESSPGSHSHTYDLKFNKEINNAWSFSFQDSYIQTPDYFTLNLDRGILQRTGNTYFDTEAATFRQNSRFNTAMVNLDYRISPRSKISFGGGHSLRNFDSDARSGRHVSNQSIFSESLRFQRSVSTRTSWSIGYTGYQFQFRDFNSARNHIVHLGLTRELSPTVQLSLSGGPSYTEAPGSGDNSLNFDGLFNISKSFESEKIDFSYYVRNGASTGAGSVSRTQSLNFFYTRSLARHLSSSIGFTAYDAGRLLDNPIGTQALGISLMFSVPINNQWWFNFGGSYHNQKGTEFFDFERKRLFVSIRMSIPELLRFEK